MATSALVSAAEAAPSRDDEKLRAGSSLSRLFAARADKPTRDVIGKIQLIDGDTFTGVRPGTKRRVIIRNAGIQAMEDRECGKKEAKRALGRLMGKRVVIVSKHNSDNHNGLGINRIQRNAFTLGGRDIQSGMIRTGLVLPYGIGRETLKQNVYAAQAQRVALAGKGLYSGSYCRPGPVQEAQLELMINYDASGRDWDNLQGKFVRIRNLSPVPVPIGKWRLRGASHDSFYFPSGTVLAAGGEVVVRLGQGSNAASASTFHWPGERIRFFVPGRSRYQGGGAYLFDRDGDIRAWSMYPCRINCGHPAAGKLSASFNRSKVVEVPPDSTGGPTSSASPSTSSSQTSSSQPLISAPSSSTSTRPSGSARPGGSSPPPGGSTSPSTTASPGPSSSGSATASARVTPTAAPSPSMRVIEESVTFTNRSSERLDLSYTVVMIRDQVHELPLGTYLDPGERLRVLMGTGVGTRLTHYLGVGGAFLFADPSGGSGKLRTHNGIRLACVAWGDRSCSSPRG